MSRAPGEAVSLEAEKFKRRDAHTHDDLPPLYFEYVQRLGYFIVEAICEEAELREGQRVLDVGTGSGLAAAAAAERVAPTGYVLGIDHSPGLVELARASAPRGIPVESLPLELRVLDAENLLLPDASFDVVVSFSAVMHFPEPERALREMYRVLKPGGRLVLTYTSIRPIRLAKLAAYGFARFGEWLETLHRPRLRAPQALASLADRYLPRLEQPAEPLWTMRRPSRRIAASVEGAGFTGLQLSWVGRNVVFGSAEDFYEAQRMISSDLRTRAGEAPAESVEALRHAFLELARGVLKQGGDLVYPFGAVVIRADRPAS